MKNSTFSLSDQSFKESKIRKVILSKISDVSDEHICSIIKSLDLEKQYFIKAVRNSRRFLNIITEEQIMLNDRSVNSKSTILYGDCLPGSFVDNFGIRTVVDGNIDASKPAAAIKLIKSCNKENISNSEYILAIYEPMPIASA